MTSSTDPTDDAVLRARLAVATRRVAPAAWVVPRAPAQGWADLLEGFGFDIVTVDLGAAVDKSTTIGAVYDAVDAPDWAGHNWDALYDVLLGRIGSSPTTAVLVSDAAALIDADPAAATMLGRILDDAATEEAGRGRALYGLWIGEGPDGVPAVTDVV